MQRNRFDTAKLYLYTIFAWTCGLWAHVYIISSIIGGLHNKIKPITIDPSLNVYGWNPKGNKLQFITYRVRSGPLNRAPVHARLSFDQSPNERSRWSELSEVLGPLYKTLPHPFLELSLVHFSTRYVSNHL